MPTESMTYAGVGVDYDAMDPFKRAAQLVARETAGNILRLSNAEFRELEASRGESVYLIEAAKSYIAHVEEGLGTKSLVGDAMYHLTGVSYYEHVALDAVAMIVNDMITLGALPLTVAMHLAVGESSWFSDEVRSRDLIHGWKRGCDLARCTWGGGETPTLSGIIMPGTFMLSGSATGLVKPKERLFSTDFIQEDDAIVFVESSGIHANGLTMARKIAEKLPDGYLTKLADGRSFGATLLDPTNFYVGLIEDCYNYGVNIHYVVNITGHGWRKLMRASQPFAYVIENMPKPHEVFEFMQKHGPVSDEEAYGNFNMGAGLALYLPQCEVPKFLKALRTYGYSDRTVSVAGHIEKSDTKKVVIKSLGIEYASETLGVR